METIGKIFTDMKDFISGSTISLEYDERKFTKIAHPIRAIVKEGETTINLGVEPKDVVTNGQVIKGATGVISCGPTITFLNGLGDFVDAADILENIDELLDPIPYVIEPPDDYYYDYENYPFIRNENFRAPAGLFSNPDQIYYITDIFNYSRFKEAPKIFSDSALQEFVEFRAYYSDEYVDDYLKVFKNCNNIESAANPGKFGDKLQVLGSIDLSYRVKGEDFDRIDAYPSGGAPKVIEGYVYGKRLSVEDKFPEFDFSRLEYCDRFFDCEEMILTGSPKLPVGGVTYKEANLTTLIMPTPKWIVDIPGSPENLNFSFSWGTLGVEAPASAKVLVGMHVIWQNFGGEVRTETHILTPERLSTVASSWGESLQEIIDGDGLEVTEDFMPLVPSGLESIASYYDKILIGGEDDIYDTALPMNSLGLKPFLNGVNRFYEVPPLPMGTGIRRIYNYVTNLYSDLEIDFNISIPAVPSSVYFLQNAYRNTFANAVGPLVPVELDLKPVVSVWYSLSEEAGQGHYIPGYFIPDYANNRVQELEDAFLGIGNVHGPAKISKFIGNPDLDPRFNPYYWSGDNVKEYTYLIDLIEDIEQSVDDNHSLYSYRITSEIVLEKYSSSNPVLLRDFQKNCFYGAAINPEVVDAVIPMPTASVTDQDNYQGVLNISAGVGGSAPTPYMWTLRTLTPMAGSGYTKTIYNDYFNDRVECSLAFTAMVTWAVGDDVGWKDYVFDISSIKWSGSPREETAWNDPGSQNVIEPYYGTLSKTLIEGDQASFMASKEIVNVDEDDFNVKSDHPQTIGSFNGPTIGWNYYIDTFSGTSGEEEIIRVLPTYNEIVYVGLGLGEFSGRIPFYTYYRPSGEPWEYNAGFYNGAGASRCNEVIPIWGQDPSYWATVINNEA